MSSEVFNRVIDMEIRALESLKMTFNDSFEASCQIILNAQGRVVLIGMGKSGLVGRKIAATMASTGTPAFFVHPGEAGHGDLGMIVKGDVVLAISNSGNSDEINLLLPVMKKLHIPLISISKNLSGRLAQEADVALVLGDFEEACPMGLAPTSSTTATMVLGDALAVALLEARGFQPEDFALSHPAGALGKKLLTKVSDLMKTADEIPIVNSDTTIMNALFEITDKRMGMTIIRHQETLGILTDGDVRRLLSQQQNMDVPIVTVMKTNPIWTSTETMASVAFDIMRERSVNQLIVLDDNGKLAGVLALRDLMEAGIN